MNPLARRSPVRIRTETDVLALVPVTLGFVPEDSLVLIAFDPAGNAFHARVDLPTDPALLGVVVPRLAGPAAQQGARNAIVVAYTDDARLASAAARLMVRALRLVDIQTVLVLRADGRRWFPLDGDGAPADDPRAVAGVPYDLRSHPLTTRSVFEGRVTHTTREELAASVTAADPEVAGAVEAALRDLGPLMPEHVEALLEEGRWLVEVVRSLQHADDPPDPAMVARLLRGTANRDVRDLLWCEITRFTAERQVLLWQHVVRRSPERHVAPAAGLLAFAAWLSGRGALAWCAVDRCLAAEPGHTLGLLVSEALEQALPPSAWQPVDPATLPLFSR